MTIIYALSTNRQVGIIHKRYGAKTLAYLLAPGKDLTGEIEVRTYSVLDLRKGRRKWKVEGVRHFILLWKFLTNQNLWIQLNKEVSKSLQNKLINYSFTMSSNRFSRFQVSM